MIAEYERAQIRERSRRGKAHRARGGSQAVLSGAPYGYRYVRKSQHMDAFYEIDEGEAEIVREVFDRYTERGESIADIARALSANGVLTRTGKQVWDRSTVWAMLRNPAYHGQAAFGKTQTTGQRAKPTRPVRGRGERHGRRETRRDVAPEQWTSIPVPALITEETFELAQARLQENKHYAKRNSREPALLKGILVCRDCGYACWRTSARTTKRRIYYYRCIGSDNYRFVGGRVCSNRPIRADELDALVWGEVEQLLSNPALVRAEIERRLTALRTESPAAHRRDGLERELARVKAGSARLIEAYQEQLITLDELRARMPALRKRETTITAQLAALDAELHDAETYLQLAENLEGFLARLAENAQNLTVEERQRIVQLVVREVLIGDDGITIRHTIPTPTGPDDPSYLLCGSSQHPALRRAAERGVPHPVLQVPGSQHLADQPKQPGIVDVLCQRRERDLVVKLIEAAGDVALDKPSCPAPRDGHLAKRGVAAAAGPVTVGVLGELRLVVRLKQQTDDFAEQLVRPRRQTQRPATSHPSSGCSAA